MRTILLCCLSLLVTLFFHSSQALAGDQLIYLISAPRSLSTAFVRMMSSRGDFQVFSEPSQAAYTTKVNTEALQEWNKEDLENNQDFEVFRPEAARNFSEVKEKLFGALPRGPVFAKEISWAVHDFVIEDIEFIRDQRVRFVFLVRDPHSIMISLYKKGGILSHWDFYVGLQSLWGIYQVAKKEAAFAPEIVFAEQLAREPEEVSKCLFGKLGLEYQPQSLSWDPLSGEFEGTREWNEIKVKSVTQLWHKEAIESSGFRPMKEYEKDSEGNPTFSEIENLEHREIFKKAYLLNLTYYRAFQNELKVAEE